MPLQSTSQLFRIYNYYRIAVGLILIFSPLILSTLSAESGWAMAVYRGLAMTYLCLHLAIAIWLALRGAAGPIQIQTSLVLEVILVVGMVIASGGVGGGLATILVVCVAATNIMLPGRFGLALAALATLLVLGIETGRVLLNLKSDTSLTNAGIFGATCFAAALLAAHLSARISASEALASSRARNIAELERLNHQIIQRMRTGILGANESGKLLMVNQAALDLLGHDDAEPLEYLPAALQERLDRWRTEPGVRPELLKPLPDRAAVRINFAELDRAQGHYIIAFLEDSGRLAQQAQQMKLASLGRLTASIAHEIRNPLGAASHAGQLLQESVNLQAEDQTLIEIILRHCQRMNGIIENVLRLSREKSSEPEEIELLTWVQAYVRDFTANYSLPYTIDVESEAEETRTGRHISGRFDPAHLEQIMNNLLSNALRYSASKTGRQWAGIRINRASSRERAMLSVIDEGPGVGEEQTPHLFEPFYTTDHRGSGLGLYICRELCHANQAVLHHSTPPGGGACFTITFAYSRKDLS